MGGVFRMSWIGSLLVAGALLFLGVQVYTYLQQEAVIGVVSGVPPVSEPVDPEIVLGLFVFAAGFFFLLALVKLIARILGFGRSGKTANQPAKGSDESRPGFAQSRVFRIFTFLFLGGALLAGVTSGQSPVSSVLASLPLYLFSLVWVYVLFRIVRRGHSAAIGELAAPERQTASQITDPWGVETAKVVQHSASSPWDDQMAQPAARSSVATAKKPESRRHSEIQTPISDAVLRKARQDPFERLQRRYRLKGYHSQDH